MDKLLNPLMLGDIKRIVGKRILNRIERAQRAIDRAGEQQSRAVLRTVARPLLNRFQRRVSCRVEFCSCNGSNWIRAWEHETQRNKARIRDLHDRLSLEALPNRRSSDITTDRRTIRLVARFPELVKLLWLAYEMDATPTRSTLAGFRPTTKPMYSKKRKRSV